MSKAQYEIYQSNAITTASTGELTLKLYNGCLMFIKKAKMAIEQNNTQEKHINIIKAQNIITELSVTLNREYAISNNLAEMYDYIKRRLIEANMKSSCEILCEIEGYIIEFRDTWKEVIVTSRKVTSYHSDGQV